MFFLPALDELDPEVVRYWLWAWSTEPHATRLWESVCC